MRRRDKIIPWIELERRHQRMADQATDPKKREQELEIVREIQAYRANYEGQQGKINRKKIK